MAEERVQSSAAAGATVLVAEELAAAPDEDYESFVRTLKASLSARRPTLLLATAGGRWDGWPPVRMLNRTWQLIRAARSVDFRAAPPAVVIYVPRSPLTLPALLRARLLRWLCGGSPVALLTLEASVGQWLPEVLLRWLAPDLLLVPTERERHAADRLGVVAATISGGVDLDRFRPAAPGERPSLRNKWRLSPTNRIVLHVGQLREGRNLRLMAALGAVPGVTAVVVASSPRGRESERLHRELWARGVIVIDGSLPEVEELYRLADCYVFPSISPAAAPALPLSILEALACDLPVVSTAFVALPERFGRVPGLDLVEHPALLPERVIAACGSAVRTRHLVEPYSWDAVAGRLEGLVSELYDRGRGAGSSVVGAA